HGAGSAYDQRQARGAWRGRHRGTPGEGYSGSQELPRKARDVGVDGAELAGRCQEHHAEVAVFRLRAEPGAVDAEHAGRAQQGGDELLVRDAARRLSRSRPTMKCSSVTPAGRSTSGIA